MSDEEIENNISHHFDLSGMLPGDIFFGCTHCWHQRRPNYVSFPKCPICQHELFEFTVTKEDMVTSKVIS